MKHKYLKNVTTLKYEESKCICCKFCIEVCPHNVFEIIDKKAQIINKDSCMECGACEMNCPKNAFSVKAGVGCARAFIYGMLTGNEPSCDCSENKENGCC